VAHALIANQSDNPSLAVALRRAGASVRTIERVFRSEVGTDFATWRRQARLMKAVELLVAGSSGQASGFRHRLPATQRLRRNVSPHVRGYAQSLGGGAGPRPLACMKIAKTVKQPPARPIKL
jgi:methylphosphotriester-DNA--protein-cysteine methyltransferase